jgi:hypothetical protein
MMSVQLILQWELLIVLLLSINSGKKLAFCFRAIVDASTSTLSYRVVDDVSSQTLFQGGDIAIFMAGKWCTDSNSTSLSWDMTLRNEEAIQGNDSTLGSFEGTQLTWDCHILLEGEESNPQTIPIITSFRNFPSAILFDLRLPNGAPKTNIANASETSMTNFPTFLFPNEESSSTWTTDTDSRFQSLPSYSYLSWHGSFVQSVRGLSTGPLGGPTVFYNKSDPELKHVMIGSPWRINNHFKSFTAGTNQDYKGNPAWAPGSSARITNLPENFSQSFLLYRGKHGGITSALHQWGTIMQQQSAAATSRVVNDVTRDKIGYQTDNGAAYCFCREANCSRIVSSQTQTRNCCFFVADNIVSKKLIDELEDLKKLQTPMGYLSFQGAGSSSGRGQAAPWCVQTWGCDGGLDPKHYPMTVKDLQQAIDVPLQLYCPYFCPSSNYFDDGRWRSVSSDTTLPRCAAYNFKTVVPEQSEAFFGWFFDKGIKAGMASFESDFMNQNFNCVPDFVQSSSLADQWLLGMADAALHRNISVQWCYATPSDVLASIDMPAVTQFRVSFVSFGNRRRRR